jgi:hypothetical protein
VYGFTYTSANTELTKNNDKTMLNINFFIMDIRYYFI